MAARSKKARDETLAQVKQRRLNLECPHCKKTFGIEFPVLDEVIHLALQGALDGCEFCQKILKKIGGGKV